MNSVGLGLRGQVAIAVVLAAHGTVAPAQEDTTPNRRAWAITPSISVQETYSDNANLSASNSQSDWITELTPGVRIDSRTARVRLYVDYRLRELLYANNSRSSQTQNTLTSFGKLEAIEDLLFVDVNGSISQQRISAFGPQSAANYSINGNSTEASSFRVSPYVKGRLAGFADYQVRYSDTRARSDSGTAADVNSRAWSGSLSGATPLVALGWTLDASREDNDYLGRRDNTSEHWRGMLSYAVTRQFRVSLSGGRERNDYVAAGMTSHTTHGYGFDWRPTERSQISAFKENRFFGNGHTLTIAHRLPRSAVKYTDSRDVSVLPPQATVVGLGTYYDLVSSMLSSTYPDETQRAEAVNVVLNGLDPNAIVTTDFISAQTSIRRRQELSYVISGVRNVVTLSLVRSHDERLGTAVLVGVNDFSSTTTINQRGFNVGWGHKLSGLSALNVVATHMRSTSGNDLNARTTHKSLSATVTTRLGAHTRGSFMARRTEYSDTVAPYSENALSGTVTVEF